MASECPACMITLTKDEARQAVCPSCGSALALVQAPSGSPRENRESSPASPGAKGTGGGGPYPSESVSERPGNFRNEKTCSDPREEGLTEKERHDQPHGKLGHRLWSVCGDGSNTAMKFITLGVSALFFLILRATGGFDACSNATFFSILLAFIAIGTISLLRAAYVDSRSAVHGHEFGFIYCVGRKEISVPYELVRGIRKHLVNGDLAGLEIELLNQKKVHIRILSSQEKVAGIAEAIASRCGLTFQQ